MCFILEIKTYRLSKQDSYLMPCRTCRESGRLKTNGCRRRTVPFMCDKRKTQIFLGKNCLSVFSRHAIIWNEAWFYTEMGKKEMQ